MRVPYLKLHLLATCVPTLWMMVFLLDQKSSQNDLRKMPRNHSKTCDCPQNSLRKCICSSEVHECSTCLGIPGESVWFDERFEMDTEPLMRAWSQRSLGIRISSHPKGLPHTHWTVWGAGLVQVGNSKFLLDSGLGLKIDQHDVVLRMNQAPVQGFEADVGKRTTVCITYPKIDSPQDPGAQLLLLPLNSSGLKCVMDTVQKDSIIQKAENPGMNQAACLGSENSVGNGISLHIPHRRMPSTWRNAHVLLESKPPELVWAAEGMSQDERAPFLSWRHRVGADSPQPLGVLEINHTILKCTLENRLEDETVNSHPPDSLHLL